MIKTEGGPQVARRRARRRDRRIAERYGCIFVNAANHIRPSKEDSLHLDPQAHAKLAEVVAEVILQIR